MQAVQWPTTCFSKCLLFSLRVQQSSLPLVSTKASSLRTAPETPAPRGNHLVSYGLYVSPLPNNHFRSMKANYIVKRSALPGDSIC